MFVSWATGSRFGLTAPWNVLDEISLDGLVLSFNFETKDVRLTKPLDPPLDLGFLAITELTLSYGPDPETNKEKAVLVSLKAVFRGRRRTAMRSIGTPPNPVLRICGMEVGRPPRARGGRAGSEIGTSPGTLSPFLSVIPPRCSSEPERLHLGAARRLTVGNDATGIARLVAWASPGALVVMEASGGD